MTDKTRAGVVPGAGETIPPAPTATARSRTLPVALVLLIVLAGVAVVVFRMTRPPEVYEPPLPPPKTVAQVQQQIDAVKNNPKIPASEKGRILGFLQMDLQKAQNNASNAAPKSP